MIMKQVYLGAMGWSYNFWPIYENASSNEYLQSYSNHFNSVEINSTFYGIPRKSSVEKWRDQTPEGFVFSVKIPRSISHSSSLNYDPEKLDAFLDIRDQPQIIRKIEFISPLDLYYEQVSRSPRDFPLVSVALSVREESTGELAVNISLGGFGQRPIQLMPVKADFERAAILAIEAYADADDAWASGEYRSHAAQVLVSRLVAKSQER